MKASTAFITVAIILFTSASYGATAPREECPTGTEGSTHGNLGAHYWENGQFSLAEKEMLEAIKFDPDCSMWHQNLAVILNSLGRADEARDSWVRSLEIDKFWCTGKRTESLFGLGQYYYGLRNYKRSIEFYEKALSNAEIEEIDDSFKSTILIQLSYNYTEPKELGNNYYNLKRAEELKKKALRLRPDDQFILASITKLLVLQDKMTEAEKNINDLIKAQAKSQRPNPVVYSYLGHIFSLLKDPVNSSVYMRKAIDLDPRQAQYLLNELDKDFRQVATAKVMQPVIQRARELIKK